MRLKFPQGVDVVCFADDASIIATRHTTWLLEKAMSDWLEMVAQWMRSHGLTISNSKSAAVMLTNKRGYVKPIFRICNTTIDLKESIRYLGVELSSVLGFRKHIDETSNKVMRTASALSRLMPIAQQENTADHGCALAVVICCAHMAQLTDLRVTRGTGRHWRLLRGKWP